MEVILAGFAASLALWIRDSNEDGPSAPFGITHLEEAMTDESWTRYKLQRKLFSIGEDFWIENDRGEPVYKVDGKVLRIRETFVL